MDLLKTLRFRLEPKTGQLDRIRRIAGCRRYVFNRLLAEREAAFKLLGEAPTREQKKPFSKEWSYVGMARRLTQWRSETDWLRDCPVHALQNGAKDLDQAYKNWWVGRCGRPTYKKKSSGSDSWRETAPRLFGVNGEAVKLPKIGWVKASISQKVVGKLRRVTVKQEGLQWYATILVMQEVEEPKPNGRPPVGIDLGVAKAVTESTGKAHVFGELSIKDKRRLRRMAKSLSRKVKGSNNRAKAKRKLANAKRKVARRTRHEIHVMTYRLAKNHGLIGMEDLIVKNMTASAAGTKEAPGKNVAAKSGLNREILARGWGEIKRQLEYKCAWYGSRLVLVPAAYSSQECSACGHVSPENRKTQESFVCVQCGHAENADVNAAKVILKRAMAAGHAVTACGEDVRRRLGHAASVKQEPTRGAQKCAV